MRWNLKQLKKFVDAINFLLEDVEPDWQFHVYEYDKVFTLVKVIGGADKKERKNVISGTARTLGYYLMGYFDHVVVDSTNPMENSIDLFWEKGNPYEKEVA